MQVFKELPTEDGLYWYFANKEKPRPVLIGSGNGFPNHFKSFNGSQQSWIHPGEYFMGPVLPPEALPKE